MGYKVGNNTKLVDLVCLWKTKLEQLWNLNSTDAGIDGAGYEIIGVSSY